MIGSVIGGGYLVERIGSRKSLMVDCLGYIIGSLLVSLTNSLPLILLGRIITGDFNAVRTNALLQIQIWIWNLESGLKLDP